MNTNKPFIAAAIGLISIGTAIGQDRKTTEPDNTRVNKQDRGSTAVTADQQSGKKADRELASKIRKAITDDKTLSTYAKNVKVVVENGVVTLRGPVRSDDERAAIDAKAKSVAGSATVNNDLSIAPEKK
jgi:hyperosmotically inducible periplasmic protein